MGMVSSGPLTLCQAFGCIPTCLGKYLSILVVLSYDLSLWPGNGVESKWRGGDFFFYIDPTNFCLGCRQKKVVNVKPWELIYIYFFLPPYPKMWFRNAACLEKISELLLKHMGCSVLQSGLFLRALDINMADMTWTSPTVSCIDHTSVRHWMERMVALVPQPESRFCSNEMFIASLKSLLVLVLWYSLLF